MPNTTTQERENQQQTSTKPDFGNGRYSLLMSEVYEGLMKLFNIPSKVSEKIARQAGSDFGAAMRTAIVEAKISRPTKDAKVTLREGSSLKGISLTNPLSLMRALQWIGEAGKNGVSYGFTNWKLTPPLAEYVVECSK